MSLCLWCTCECVLVECMVIFTSTILFHIHNVVIVRLEQSEGARDLRFVTDRMQDSHLKNILCVCVWSCVLQK